MRGSSTIFKIRGGGGGAETRFLLAEATVLDLASRFALAFNTFPFSALAPTKYPPFGRVLATLPKALALDGAQCGLRKATITKDEAFRNRPRNVLQTNDL